jgi:hypothetical protein
LRRHPTKVAAHRKANGVRKANVPGTANVGKVMNGHRKGVARKARVRKAVAPECSCHQAPVASVGPVASQADFPTHF